METLKDYLRFKKYINKIVWVYTYNKMGEKVLLFGNKAEILYYTLGFTFLDCEVVNIDVSYINSGKLNEIDEIDIIINYRG